MPRRVPSVLERITIQQDKLKLLAEQRNKELLDIINKCQAISIDDELFAGFLLFTKQPKNKDHPIFTVFRDLAKAHKIPFQGKRRNRKKTKDKG